MTILRSDIESALKELKSYEEWLRFQRIAVSIVQRIQPEFIACERRDDLGLDAHAHAAMSTDGIAKGLAASITAEISKILSDAKKVQQHYDDIKVLIFATSEYVTKETEKSWIDKIKKEFGYQLIVMSREDIVTRLMNPSNIDLCRILGISTPVEHDATELANKVREAASKLIDDRLSHPPLAGKFLLSLRTVRLDDEGRESGEILQLDDVKRILTHGCRIILEAPAGRGKSTTLVQLAKRDVGDTSIALLIDLPAWMMSGKDILEYIAGLQHFRSRNIDAQTIANIYNTKQVTFLLNGWNELSDNYSEKAHTELQQLDRTFPAAGIIVTTRTHHLIPPLLGASRMRLLPLNRMQRTEYLKGLLKDQADSLRSKLDNDPVLDQLTRTPLILSKVVDIFIAGLSIPATKIGVLDAVIKLIEQSIEHKNQLQLPPLSGHARAYLSELAMQMMSRAEVIIPEQDSRPIVGSVSVSLRDSGQISTVPEPQTVLNELCKRHVLERDDYLSVTLRFEHQQFQEFFAALRLKSELLALIKINDETAIREFTKQYVNEPVWAEPLQMLAEEIGVHGTEKPDEKDLIKAGVLLVKMALSVDPIFAADLVRLCGPAVWKDVGALLSDFLRAWYKSKNRAHRECALAGMMASGSPDFNDIILPLLTNDDHQIRLSTYRESDEFHLSTLGSDWKNVVRGWKEEARIDFVREVTQHRWIPEIVDEFVLRDPSMAVRVAGIEWLSWVGSREEVGSALEMMDQATFDQAIRQMSPEEVPPAVRSRSLDAYKKIYSESTDAVSRLRVLLSQAKLGTEMIEGLKTELNNLDQSKMKDIGEFLIKPALDIVQKTDPQWASHWVAEHVAGGSLWYDHWRTFISTIPKNIIDTWMQQLANEDLKHQPHSSINDLLAIGADKAFSEKIFSRLCELKDKIVSTPNERHEKDHTIVRQLEDLFRALSPQMGVAGLLSSLGSNFDNIQFLVAIDLLSSVGRKEPSLQNELDPDLRQMIRKYLIDGESFVLSEKDYDGSLKADFATSLSRVGNEEDIDVLRRMISADIQRCREGRAVWIKGDRTPFGNGGICSSSGWHIQALICLNRSVADKVIVDLLNEPEYECDCATALIELATIEQKPHAHFGFRINYNEIWEARTGKISGRFNEERRKEYASALRDRICHLLDPSKSNGERSAYNIKKLGHALAVLDPKESSDLVIKVMLLPGKWDDWCRAQALESLLFGGAELPADAILNLFELTLQNVRQNASHDDRENLLRHFLCLLPFLTKPDEGIKKIKETISEFSLPRHLQRDIITALGHSRCKEAFSLLRELAGSSGEHIEDLGESWLNALAILDTPESKKLLMSFVDPDIREFQATPKIGRADILASHIADLACKDPEIEKRLIDLCNTLLTAEKRELLSEVIARLDAPELMIAGLNLIDDAATPPIPYSLSRKLENAFVEHRPYGKSGSTFTLSPRSSNIIRKQLFEMSINDGRRKQTAYALLGEIEARRLDYGKPTNEPRHPFFESGKQWPPCA